MPDPEWLIDGLIQRRTTAVLFGKSNAFKTFIGIDVGLSVATGRPWHGHKVIQGRVLFVATEGAIGVAKARIPAWYDYHNIGAGDRQNAFLHPKEIGLDRPDDVSDLITAMKKIGSFELVVFDIFGGTMAGSEVEDKTAKAWSNHQQKILGETGAALLTIAHTGWQDDTRARMHTHTWGSFDTRMRAEGDKDAMTTTLAINRHKDADSSGFWGFNLVQSGRSLVPVLNAEIKTPSRAKKGSGKEQVAIDALIDALETHGEEKKAGANWPSCKVVKVEHWRHQCELHGLSQAPLPASRRKAFDRQCEALVDRKKVRVFRDYAWLCFD